MADLVFHILDIADRDEEVVKEDVEMKEVAYESGDDGSDNENNKKSYNAKGTESFVVHLFGSTADGTPVRVDSILISIFVFLMVLILVFILNQSAIIFRKALRKLQIRLNLFLSNERSCTVILATHSLTLSS